MKGGLITLCFIDVEVVVVEDEIDVVKMGVVISGVVRLKGICTRIETTCDSKWTRIVGIKGICTGIETIGNYKGT